MSHPKESTPRAGLYYVIPAAIMDSDALIPIEKLLYCLLSGLADADGSCFPSDEYLCKRLHAGASSLKRYLANLESLKLITRQTHRCKDNPFKQYRTIWVHTEFKKCLPSVSGGPPGGLKIETSEASKLRPIVSEAILVSEEREGVPPPLAPIPSTSSKKIERQPHVSTTEEEHIRLSADFGEPVRDSAYKRLSEWKQNTPKSKWKLHDNLTIRSWVIEAIREESLKKGKSGLDTNGNKTIFDKLKQKFSNHRDIIFGENYIEFNFGQSNHPHVRLTDNGFEEQVQNNLRKMGLKL